MALLPDFSPAVTVLAANPFTQWFADNGAALVAVPLRIILIVAIAVVLRLLAGRLITQSVNRLVSTSQRKTGPAKPDEKSERIAAERRRQRGQTLGSVLRSTASIIIFAVAAMVVLGEFGINLAPIIAGAGIIGLAVGFGAQSLVSDFVSGMFMLIEDQYGVGDWVDAGEASGEVEEIGLRVIKLRDGNGVLWFVRNGVIARVGNHSQGWARTLLEVPVAYDEDVDRASELLTETARELTQDDDYRDKILEDPEVWGVTSLGRDAVVLQLAVTTAPLQQWGVGRELRRRIKARFDEHGVQIPLQQQAVWVHNGQPAVAAGNGAKSHTAG